MHSIARAVRAWTRSLETRVVLLRRALAQEDPPGAAFDLQGARFAAVREHQTTGGSLAPVARKDDAIARGETDVEDLDALEDRVAAEAALDALEALAREGALVHVV